MVTLSGKNRDEDSMTRVVVSNVQVLTAGTRYDQEKAKDGEPIPSTVVTLLVSPDDGERVALAASEGQIMLTLRNPLDQDPTATTGVRTAALFGQPRRAGEDAGGAPRPGQAAATNRRAVEHRSSRLHRRGHPRREAIAGDCSMSTLKWQMRPAHASSGLALTLVLAGQCQLPMSAQQPAARAAAPAQAAVTPARPQFDRVLVTAGRSTVVATDFDVTRIAVTNPDVADAVVVQPREILIDGKKAGTVSLIVWRPTSASSTTSSSNRRSPRSSSSCRRCSRVKTSRSASATKRSSSPATSRART